VGDLIKREIAHIIQYELKDPGIGFVTITDVKMSGDLKQARVFYTVLGNQDCKENSAEALKRACGFVQREIGRKLRLRYTPEISFCFDASVERGAHIEELIQKIHSQPENTDEQANLDAPSTDSPRGKDADDDEGQTEEDTGPDRR
jgi:ribosome-binding factor A